MISSSRKPTPIDESLFDVGDLEGDAPTQGELAFERKDKPSPEMQRLIAEKQVQADRKKKRPKTIAAAVFNRSLAEVDTMIDTGDWTDAGVRHLVALYDRMHTRCYGVEPAELGPAERWNAMMLAANMLKREFSDDLVKMVEFMLWAWAREESTEKWRRENRQPGRRIGVRLMFANSLLTDYRVHLARKSTRL